MFSVIVLVALFGACNALAGCQAGRNSGDPITVGIEPVTLAYNRKADGSDPMECRSIFKSNSDKNLVWNIVKLDNVKLPLMWKCHREYYLELRSYNDLTDLTKPIGVMNYCGNAKYGFSSVSTSWGSRGKYVVVDFKGDGSEDRMFEIQISQM